MNTPSQRFLKALEFAGIAHRDQVRKGTQIPYITHPVAVSWILREAGLEIKKQD